MKLIKGALIAAISLSSFPVLAHMAEMDSNCKKVAEACLKAGYDKEDKSKQFWHACMKPVLTGKTVAGVTVDAATVTACRTAKIEKMKGELQELQNVK